MKGHKLNDSIEFRKKKYKIGDGKINDLDIYAEEIYSISPFFQTYDLLMTAKHVLKRS